MNKEQQLKLSDAADELLEEGNSVAVVMRIQGDVVTAKMKLPVVLDLVSDDNIGELGFGLAHNLDLLSKHMVKKFNQIVEEKK